MVKRNIMANVTGIEWCDHTDNLWHGCTKVNKGCDNCYAETLSIRWKRDIWGNDKPRLIINSVWKNLDLQQKAAAKDGVIRRAFVGSMMDIFEKPMPLIDGKGNLIPDLNTGDLRRILFKAIDAGKYPNLQLLLLTKRPGNIPKYVPKSWLTKPPSNVMYGCSIVDQKTADTLLLIFLKVNGPKFLSMEPLVGPVEPLFVKLCPTDFYGPANRYMPHNFAVRGAGGIEWVIVGGESGKDLKELRLMHPDWVRAIRDNCIKAGVPFFFKQWGEYHINYHPVAHNNYRTLNNFLDWIQGANLYPESYKAFVNGGRCIGIDGTECIEKEDFAKAQFPIYILDHVGKKKAGHVLDGKVYQQFPKLSYE